MLGSVLKLLDVVVKNNTSPGKLAVVEQTRRGATFVCLFVTEEIQYHGRLQTRKLDNSPILGFLNPRVALSS